LKLLPLFAIVALAPFVIKRSDLAATAGAVPLSLNAVTAAATLALWALLGLESATIPAEKVRDPARTIPRATLVGTILTAVICAIACSAVLILHSNAPFADLAARFWGAGAGKLLAIFAAISAFGCLNGWVLLQAELPAAMAKRGVFPRWFAHESTRHVPDYGLFFSSVLVSLLLLSNYQRSMVIIFTKMALLSTTACLVLYLVCSLALLRLQWLGTLKDARGTTLTLALAGGAAAAYSLWAIVGAGAEAVLWGLGLLIIGLPVYALTARKPTA
jgi:APA family basic amino acid/polyamine antiporter